MGILSINIYEQKSIQLNHIRKIPEEDHIRLMEEYRLEKTDCKERHRAALEQWQLDKQQYTRDKAAYDVHKAQLKLDSLQSQ